MVIKLRLKKFIKNLAIPLAVGAIAGFLTRNGVEEFMMTAEKPFFMPPGWLFPVVWTILYALMGWAAYLVEVTPVFEKRRALTLYYVQLFFNFWWSFIFFSLGSYLFAFIWIAILWLLIILTVLEFYKVNKKASFIMIPYLIWVTFAAVLNFSIYLLNR